MDLLDFEGQAMYFDAPLGDGPERLLQEAAACYPHERAEHLLLRAYFLAPEHLAVLVALYRFYYYRHRYGDALQVAERTLQVAGRMLGLRGTWSDFDYADLANAVVTSIVLTRFYLLALKGTGFLLLRLGDPESAVERLRKVVQLDSNDRLGAGPLLDLALGAMAEPSGRNDDGISVAEA